MKVKDEHKRTTSSRGSWLVYTAGFLRDDLDVDNYILWIKGDR